MTSYGSRRSCLLAAFLLAASSHVSAAPATRDTPQVTPHTIQDYTMGAIQNFLAAWNAQDAVFNVKGPWTSIDFAGSSAPQLSEGQINNDVFQSCDNQADRATNKTISFSDGYKDFVQDLNKAVPAPAPSQKMNDTAAAMQTACYNTSTLPAARAAALNTYNSISSTPVTNASDPNFLQWADTGYPDYINAYTACQQATLTYYAAFDDNNGDDSGVYTAARTNVQPLLDSSISHPGINMPIEGATSTPGLPSEGAFVAYYSIPTLNSTLTAWQAGSGLSPVNFTNAQYSSNTTHTTSEAGIGLGFIFEEIFGEGEGSNEQTHSSADVSSLKFELNFGGLALLDVSQGIWFDGYRVARAAENPDAQHQQAKPVFSDPKYFGSQDKPGSLALYNTQALIGFKPSWTIQFTDSHQTDDTSKSEGEAGLSIFGLFDIGGWGGSTSNTTHYDNSTNTLTIQDNSNNAYVIGYVQTPYY
ncbi:hypothetical protein GGX14DRAFT_665920 [Mycena pura]|uniref:Acid protease n=1 Tax=Mycena pura TaxID=153505 RepID=A0AAD6Y7X7_9AGAR|nr:hypothetical protein GGX14DRAFT_665920 [Mycena pura]